MQALGLIETRGFTGAVEALDVAVKTANVRLLGIEIIGSGLVTIQITGDVSAVKVSIDAAVIGAQRIGEVVAAHVIPRPYDEIAKLIKSKEVEKQPESQMEPEMEPEPEPELDSDLEPEAELESISELKLQPGQLESYTEEELNGMKVVDLRTLLRSFPGLKIKRNQIKFMNKEELLEAIQKFYQQNKTDFDI